MSFNVSNSSAHLFNGRRDDHPAWKQLVQAQLTQSDLWEMVQRQPTSPMSAEILREDAKSQGMIRSLITSNEAPRTELCTDAAELWRKLQENCEGTREHILRTARKSFMQFKSAKGEGILELCGRFEGIIGRLEAAGHTIDEGEKIEKFCEVVPRRAKEHAKLWTIANKSAPKVSDLIREIKEFEYDGVVADKTERAMMTNAESCQQQTPQIGSNQPNKGNRRRRRPKKKGSNDYYL